jgi:biofilm PGA synthesis protein PgaD
MLMALTLAGWTYYAYLAFPLVAVATLPPLAALADLVLPGPSRVTRRTEDLTGPTVDPVLLTGLVGTSLFMAVLLLTWAEAQRRRFTGVERRQRSPDAPLAEVAAALGAADQVIEALGSSRIVTLRMRADGTPEHAEATLPGVTGDERADAGPVATSFPMARIPLPRRRPPAPRHRDEDAVPLPVREPEGRAPRHRAELRSS